MFLKITILGKGWLEALCFDGIRRLWYIRGKLRKRFRYLRYYIGWSTDYQGNEADVI